VRFLRHVKVHYSIKKILVVAKIHRNFSPRLSCFAARCVCWLLPECSGVRIINYWNSGGEWTIDHNDRIVRDDFCDTNP
jgi:hypothetical protein